MEVVRVQSAAVEAFPNVSAVDVRLVLALVDRVLGRVASCDGVLVLRRKGTLPRLLRAPLKCGAEIARHVAHANRHLSVLVSGGTRRRRHHYVVHG